MEFRTLLAIAQEFAQSTYHAPARRLRLDLDGDLSIDTPVPIHHDRGCGVVAKREEPTTDRMPSPACSVDIIMTLHERGERLTREELVAALDKAKRRWSESVVGEVASFMVRVGLLTNVRPRGYGLPGWE